ncbi:histidine kinase [Desulfotignum phosphitoxidans]|uniref:histidine kinase n=1 Tax=Desulfotignum phosphitoxidans TaxID=190898 RepID=UPI00034A3A43|nr:histidine kinase [Desulfotignum phosphitoxidans]
MKTEKEIKKRLAELKILIQDTKDRLPAHSVKPPVMMDLLAYEDEYDDLRKQLANLKK